MFDLQPLDARHAAAVLRFERENRAYFARTIRDRGDGYFAHFAARHAALLAEQDTGRCRFHVMVDDAAAVLGRFNLTDIADGAADLGYRVAAAVAGRGLAKEGVRRICVLARDEYRLTRLVAYATLDNPASLAVLRGTGFVATDEIEHDGRPGLRHVRELTASP